MYLRFLSSTRRKGNERSFCVTPLSHEMRNCNSKEQSDLPGVIQFLRGGNTSLLIWNNLRFRRSDCSIFYPLTRIKIQICMCANRRAGDVLYKMLPLKQRRKGGFVQLPIAVGVREGNGLCTREGGSKTPTTIVPPLHGLWTPVQPQEWSHRRSQKPAANPLLYATNRPSQLTSPLTSERQGHPMSFPMGLNPRHINDRRSLFDLSNKNKETNLREETSIWEEEYDCHLGHTVTGQAAPVCLEKRQKEKLRHLLRQRNLHTL